MGFGLLGAGSHLQLGQDNGFEFGYIMNEQIQFSISYWQAKIDLGSVIESPVYEADAEMSGSFFGAGARYFTGNSFFFEGGIAQRKQSFSYSFLVEENSTNGEATASAYTLNFAIGNQWMIHSGVVLNFNWIGIATPITNKSSVKSTYKGPFSETIQQAMASSEDELFDIVKSASKSTSPIISASIGYMF